MPYEEINGEIMVMSNDAEPGLSGTSTEYDGADSHTFEVRWVYPGGIINFNWHGLNDNYQITNIADDTGIQREEKINSINGIVYGHVKDLLTIEGWDYFYDHYSECVTIRM